MSLTPLFPEPTSGVAPVALVTGAAARIGASMVRRLHMNGYRLVIHYNTSAVKAQALAEELNAARSNSACTFQADLTDNVQVLQLAQLALEQWGRMDVLINNASGFYPVSLGAVQEDDWARLVHTNARAPLFLCRELAPALQKSRGCILNIVDSTALYGVAGFTPYTMAKAALANMTRSLAKELAPAVRVNGISPGVILWPEFEGGMSESEKETVLKRTALQRIGSVDDISHAALFLIREATYITGQIIRVDGGAALFG